MVSTSSSRHCGQRRPVTRRRRRRRHPKAEAGVSHTVGGAPRSRGRSTGVLRAVVGVLLLCCLSSMLQVPVAEAMAVNDQGTETTSLGLLAQACASSYCGVGMTALDLWLSLEEKCDVESTPSITTLWASGGSGAVLDASGNWSVTSAALVCACVWSVLVYAGFRSGVRVGTQTKGGYPVA